MDKLPNIHPGEVLLEDYLRPLGRSIEWLADGLGMPAGSVAEILDGKRPITPETALRLACFFGASAQFWLNLQTAYDLIEERDRLAHELGEIRPFERVA